MIRHYKRIYKPEFVVAPLEVSPLSKETDPRAVKLKKELEKLSIAPKPKYIKLFK